MAGGVTHTSNPSCWRNPRATFAHPQPSNLGLFCMCAYTMYDLRNVQHPTNVLCRGGVASLSGSPCDGTWGMGCKLQGIRVRRMNRHICHAVQLLHLQQGIFKNRPNRKRNGYKQLIGIRESAEQGVIKTRRRYKTKTVLVDTGERV